MEQEFKYFAFISYNSKDTEWGKRVQKKLESYKMPSMLCSERGWRRRPINPVFFAPTDIQPGGLSEELQERLKASRNLIVICSPNSARSEWVGKEIEFFHNLGRTKQIHFFIVDGIPHSGNPVTECFNPVVDRLGLPEILGANIHEQIYRWPWLNKERAYVQLVSKLLGVEFDAIWQRHKRQLVQKMVGYSIAALIILASLIGVWNFSKPIDIEVQLNETSFRNPNLPKLKDAIVTMELKNESKTDTIYSIEESTTFSNIPHHYLGEDVHVSFRCRDFLSLDTVLALGSKVQLNIKRNDSVYGTIHFTLWNINKEVPVPNTSIIIGDTGTKSDDKGVVRLFIPLDKQRLSYRLKSMLPLADTVITVPHTEDAVVIVE